MASECKQNGGKARRGAGGPSEWRGRRSIPETMKHAFMDDAAKRLICCLACAGPAGRSCVAVSRLRMYVWSSIRAVQAAMAMHQNTSRAQKTREREHRPASDLLAPSSRHARTCACDVMEPGGFGCTCERAYLNSAKIDRESAVAGLILVLDLHAPSYADYTNSGLQL